MVVVVYMVDGIITMVVVHDRVCYGLGWGTHVHTNTTTPNKPTHLDRIPLVLHVPGGGGAEEVAGQRVARVGDALIAGLAQDAARLLSILFLGGWVESLLCGFVVRVLERDQRGAGASRYNQNPTPSTALQK